jgi:hypothetical protein
VPATTAAVLAVGTTKGVTTTVGIETMASGGVKSKEAAVTIGAAVEIVRDSSRSQNARSSSES